jgi:hypothetical protein
MTSKGAKMVEVREWYTGQHRYHPVAIRMFLSSWRRSLMEGKTNRRGIAFVEHTVVATGMTLWGSVIRHQIIGRMFYSPS